MLATNGRTVLLVVLDYQEIHSTYRTSYLSTILQPFIFELYLDTILLYFTIISLSPVINPTISEKFNQF
jgi:hypothetical protein